MTSCHKDYNMCNLYLKNKVFNLLLKKPKILLRSLLCCEKALPMDQKKLLSKQILAQLIFVKYCLAHTIIITSTWVASLGILIDGFQNYQQILFLKSWQFFALNHISFFWSLMGSDSPFENLNLWNPC